MSIRVKEVGMPLVVEMNILILNPNRYLALKLNSKYDSTIIKLVKTNKQNMPQVIKLQFY